VNEITVTASLSAYKASVMSSAIGRSVTGLTFTMTGSFYIEGVVSVGITATLIPLGGVTAPHWGYFINKDSTNYLTIRNGATGADVGQLFPGEPAYIPLLSTGVYYAVANTAPCLLEYMVLSL
jgi:hypothetical protein